MPLQSVKLSTKNASLVLLGALFFLAAILRIYQLDRTLGGADENAMLLYFGYSPLKVITTNYWEANNHVFHSILVHLMGVWFGEENAVALRFPTLLFGLAGLWMIYRIAQELFGSPLIARMTLLIAAVNPVHIHYSQTARGYSLIIFFSAAMILVSLKVLRSGISTGRGALLAVCGFLSVYTLPTNIYFLFGLAAWVFAVLILPDPQQKFSSSRAERKQKIFFFLNVALAIAVLCWVAYAPLLGQMMETIQKHQLMTVETQWNSVPVLIPGILEKVFPSGLLVFIPFLILGLVTADARDHSYQTLPLTVFFLPLAITLISGVGGYPRNYLYNFPFLIILMAAGMVRAGEYCGRIAKDRDVPRWAALGMGMAFCLLSVNVLFQEYYPSLKIGGGKEYKQSILEHVKPHDLVAIQSSENYLYARSVYRENLINIINDRRLTGFHLITPKDYDLFEYAPPPGKKVFQLIKQFGNSVDFPWVALNGETKMTALTVPKFASLIPENFEGWAPWEIIKGKGTVSKITDAGTQDGITLKLNTLPEDEMIVKGPIPGVLPVPRLSVAVLVWSRKLTANELIYSPNLVVDVHSPEGSQMIQMNLGKINDGINIYLVHGNEFNSQPWALNSAIGLIPPGNYSFSLWLKCGPGQTAIFDEFRLFLIEIADKKADSLASAN